MIILLRTLLHRIRLLKWAVLPRSTALDFYGEAIKSVAGRWNTELGPVTTYHALCNLFLDHDSFKLDIAFYEKFGALTGGKEKNVNSTAVRYWCIIF